MTVPHKSKLIEGNCAQVDLSEISQLDWKLCTTSIVVLPHLVALKCSSENGQRRIDGAVQLPPLVKVGTLSSFLTMFSHSLSHSPIQKESPAFIMKDVCMYLLLTM